MLNFLPNILIVSLLFACQSEERTELPKSHLSTTNKPIIRKFRYNELEAWIVKPKVAQMKKLYLAQNIQKKELLCLETEAEKAANTIMLLSLQSQEELAVKYLTSMDELSLEITVLECP